MALKVILTVNKCSFFLSLIYSLPLIIYPVPLAFRPERLKWRLTVSRVIDVGYQAEAPCRAHTKKGEADSASPKKKKIN
jgi:hypothetical protein